jgi:hypothetical protein
LSKYARNDISSITSELSRFTKRLTDSHLRLCVAPHDYNACSPCLSVKVMRASGSDLMRAVDPGDRLTGMDRHLTRPINAGGAVFILAGELTACMTTSIGAWCACQPVMVVSSNVMMWTSTSEASGEPRRFGRPSAARARSAQQRLPSGWVVLPVVPAPSRCL